MLKACLPNVEHDPIDGICFNYPQNKNKLLLSIIR